jgi:hypothetical protein
LDEHTIQEVSQDNDDVRSILNSAPPSASMILGPQGELLAQPQVEGEGIVAADLDIALSIEQKQFHDIVGYYNRFDVFRLVIDQRPQEPISVISGAMETRETARESDRSSLDESTTMPKHNEEYAGWKAAS